MSKPAKKIEYKVIELAPVTEEEIERCLNTWTGQGWGFDDIRFVMRDGVRRPGLAYVFFTRVVS